MSKSIKRGDKEYDQLARLKHENKKLKRQVKQLRKIIDKLDLDRYHDVKDLIDQLEKSESSKSVPNDKWKCWDCVDGVLRMHPIMRPDGEFYFRMCDVCRKRTKLKRYNGKEGE